MSEDNSWLINFCIKQGAQKGDAEHLRLLPLLEAWREAETLLGLSSHQIAAAVSKAFELDIAKLDENLDASLFNYVPRSIAQRYNIFPLAKDHDKISVASASPADGDMESMLGFLTALHVETRIAAPELISDWISQHYEPETDVKKDVKIQPKRLSSQVNKPSDSITEDSAIVEIVSDMFLEAFALNASDIHIEPFGKGGAIRYRVDGMLRMITELPEIVFLPILQRVKAISGLNLANKLIPQDGGASLMVKGQPVDLRVSTIPVDGGEKAVIRLLIQSTVGTIDQIGLPEPELERFRSMLGHSSGIFVITGPTGSGKSTTLYSALKGLNTFDRCLVTVEDPIEYKIDGIAQIRVNPAQNVTFNTALRHILRQDPDVILVGEVRDEETAQITLRAAMTGHFVMTTLHTNDAVTTIPRLIGLGVNETVLADSLRGVAAQRLVRRLCDQCSTESVSESQLYSARFKNRFPEATIRVAAGCESCSGTGYNGRFPIFEIITIDNILADAIRKQAESSDLRRIAKEGGNRPMSEIAKDAILQGKTSVEEVHRVLGEQFWSEID